MSYDTIDKLIQRRRELGLTQKEIAQQMGCDQTTVSKFELSNGNVRLNTLRRYCKAVQLQGFIVWTDE